MLVRIALLVLVAGMTAAIVYVTAQYGVEKRWQRPAMVQRDEVARSQVRRLRDEDTFEHPITVAIAVCGAVIVAGIAVLSYWKSSLKKAPDRVKHHQRDSSTMSSIR